jgi:hypothetical protein
MAPSCTFSFLTYNLCSFQPILKSEYILEMPFDVFIIIKLVFLTHFFPYIHRHHYNQNHPIRQAIMTHLHTSEHTKLLDRHQHLVDTHPFLHPDLTNSKIGFGAAGLLVLAVLCPRNIR